MGNGYFEMACPHLSSSEFGGSGSSRGRQEGAEDRTSSNSVVFIRKQWPKLPETSEEMLSEFFRFGTSLNLLELKKEVLLCYPVLSKEDVICFILIYGNKLQLFSLFMRVFLTSLVYEKQQKLRIMMKMHGLGDDPYWMITYAYFLVIYLAYMLCFVLFGSVIGLKFFTLNDYNIQFVFYFIYINLQISLAFLVASIFANVKTAAEPR
ncbi:ABC transporter A family member 7 [Camellia lanceoleosa]|nr:ABC transporter A family member 7 [Camellia lanceoleosa]